MKAIILAAGYATRLYPLTENMPKALLKVNEKTILDYICDEIDTINEVDEIIIVSNNKFYTHFSKWAEIRKPQKKLKVINDGTTSDEDKLGAIADINLIINEMRIQDDILVIAGDNLFNFKLIDFYNFFKANSKDCMCVYEQNDITELQRMGVAQLDKNNKIIDFEEKPKNPKSNIAVTACYIYKEETLPLFDKYLKLGKNPDSPGNFPAWLYKEKDVYGYIINGQCFDIGTHEAYKEVQELYNTKLY